MSRKRVVILGAGAIGGAMAADLLDHADAEVALIARTRFPELVVEHPRGTSRHSVTMFGDPDTEDEVLPADWLLLATKAHQSEAALPWFKRLVTSRTRIAVLQNGIDHVERGSEYGLEMNARYTRERYHMVTDEFDDTWDLSGAVDDVVLYYEIGSAVIESDTWPNWNEGTEFRAIREESRR